MMRRATIRFQAAVLLLVNLSIYINLVYFKASAQITDPSSEQSPPFRDGDATILQMAPYYVKAIMTPKDTSFPRLDCPTPRHSRYEYLRSEKNSNTEENGGRKYFFALDLHQCASLLPRLIGSVVESMRHLGPKNCALSIVEGRSDDGTFEILELVRAEIESLGAKYYFNTNNANPTAHGEHERIRLLADLRNGALQPLKDHKDLFSTNTTVIFLNDVSICMEDILELIHQRAYQNADMTCAMDWTYVGRDPTFYDIWIARDMEGDSFFNVPADGNWNEAWNLFWDNPSAQERFYTHKPFQVFSCWNGAVTFSAKPILEDKLRFRSSVEDECFQGEPQLFCKDMWYQGYGKIAVVPSVNLGYSDDDGRKLKDLKGYTSHWVQEEAESGASMQIEWDTNPPNLVKCISSYAAQSWSPWNEALI